MCVNACPVAFFHVFQIPGDNVGLLEEVGKDGGFLVIYFYGRR